MSKGTSAVGVLVGRMGAAIEVKDLSKDNRVGNIRLATASGWGDKVVTSWHNIVVYNKKTIEVIEAYTDKGSRIMVTGEIVNRQYENKAGANVTVTEIIVGYSGSIEIIDGVKEGDARTVRAPNLRADREPVVIGPQDDIDDVVPF